MRFKKEHLFTALKLTWEGNLNQRACSVCCAEWWFSVDGGRCTSFEDITTSIFSEDAVDMSAPTTLTGGWSPFPLPLPCPFFLSNYVSTLTGVCSEVGNIPIFVGYHNIKLEVGPCPGHFISDTASGYFSTSRVIIEEVPLGEWVVREQQLCFQSYSLLLSYSFICVCSSRRCPSVSGSSGNNSCVFILTLSFSLTPSFVFVHPRVSL